MSYPFIYLASQSPRRQELLKQIGVRFELLLPSKEEDAEALESALPHEAALDYVQRVTRLKVEAAKKRMDQRHMPFAPILCADTTVAISLGSGDKGSHEAHEQILGKPQDDEDARHILQLLSGKTHQVHTAVAVMMKKDDQELVRLLVSTSNVTFKALSSSDISAYIASQEHLGKAGAYGIQGIAACFVENIQGSFSGIMGLPIFETAQLLQESDVQFGLNSI
jgi:septum formation protein